MNLYAGGLIAVAAVCAMVGLQHLLIAARLEKWQVRLLFAVAAFAAAADALVEIRLFRSETPAEYQSLMPWTALLICSFLAALAWFIAHRTGASRRWLLIAETVALAATAALDFGLPTGIAFLDIEALRDVVLPWGETLRLAVGVPNPWRVVGDIANVGFLVYLLDTTVRLLRRGQHRDAWLIGGSLVVLGLSVLAIIPTDLGLVELPAIHPFAFLLIVAAMSWDLSDAVARGAALSREVLASERRWRQVLERVQLLAVHVDTDGRIAWVNPFALDATGYAREELVGRHFAELLSADVRDDALADFASTLARQVSPEVERRIVTRDGSRRDVVWRTVLLTDASDGVEGVLSLGADVTERRTAEADLQRALVELERLRDQLEQENIYLKEELTEEHGFADIVGDSNPLLYVLHKVRQVASSDASVLILGETGVGKELIARTIHSESHRSDGRFVKVNCAGLPPNLVETELFGHERGAFTGAERRRLGRFELAHGGTLFLDEVGELPLEVQPKLLRALQDGEIERVGGTETIAVDVRVIAATNRDLAAEMDAGRFREDLFYRLDVYPITVPPLRQRTQDIPALVQHFVGRMAAKHRAVIREIPAPVMARLQEYSWPGNVRELQNVIERAVLTSREGVLRLADPFDARSPTSPIAASESSAGRLESLAEAERQHILRALDASEGKIAGPGGAAEVLGVHPNTLRYRLKKLGVTSHRTRNGR